MADRVKFAFTRVGKLMQAGTVEIDLLDPTDPQEIREKLQTKDFASFRVLAEEIKEPTWDYQPFIEGSDNS